MEKSCQLNGVCEYRYMKSCGFGCKYIGYCDYQTPRDSRNGTLTSPMLSLDNNDSIEFSKWKPMC